MASSSFGDVKSIKCIHPTLGQFNFKAKANVDCTYMVGGLFNDDTDDGVDSSGQPMFSKTAQRSSFEIVINCGGRVIQDIQALMSDSQDGVWAVEGQNNVLRLTGQPVGAVSANFKTGVMTLKVAGDYNTFRFL